MGIIDTSKMIRRPPSKRSNYHCIKILRYLDMIFPTLSKSVSIAFLGYKEEGPLPFLFSFHQRLFEHLRHRHGGNLLDGLHFWRVLEFSSHRHVLPRPGLGREILILRFLRNPGRLATATKRDKRTWLSFWKRTPRPPA